MTANVQMTFRDFPPPQLAEERIQERVDRLDKLHPRITSCRIVAETPHRHHHTGTLYLVRIDLTIPGGKLVVNRDHNDKHAHEDFFVAVRDAFNAMEQKLRAYSQRKKGKIKAHEVPPHGRITKLFPDYGFIATPDGEEVYFHANSVVDGDYENLEIGTEVRVVVAEGESEKGPQATTVKPIGKHHLP